MKINLSVINKILLIIFITIASSATFAQEVRPSTKEERRFSSETKKKINNIMQKAFPLTDYDIEGEIDNSEDNAFTIGSETNPYFIRLKYNLKMKFDSPKYEKTYQSMMEATMKMFEVRSKNKISDEERCNVRVKSYESFNVTLEVNSGSSAFGVLKNYEKLNVKNTRHSLRSDNAINAYVVDNFECYDLSALYFGDCNLIIEDNAFGDKGIGKAFEIKANFNSKITYLNVQNIMIEIRAPKDIADDIIKNLDTNSLNNMIDRK